MSKQKTAISNRTCKECEANKTRVARKEKIISLLKRLLQVKDKHYEDSVTKNGLALRYKGQDDCEQLRKELSNIALHCNSLVEQQTVYRKKIEEANASVEEKNAVYTVNSESQHLLIYRVPAINLQDELFTLCQKFGEVSSLCKLELIEPEDEFTEIYHACYRQIHKARVAKKEMDGKSFFGGLLHVCYAPELESVEETRLKLIHRRTEIAYVTGRKRRRGLLSTRLDSSTSRATRGRPLQHNNKRLKLDSTEECYRMNNFNETNKSLASASNAPSFVNRSYDPVQLVTPPLLSSDVPGGSANPYPIGPYDRPCFYESQQRLELPGQEVAISRLKKMTPSVVVRKLANTKTNKIVFH